MSTARNVTVNFLSDPGLDVMSSSTGVERDNIKDMKIGDRIKAYCVPVGEGDYKTDTYITLDINDALDHIEKFHNAKFNTSLTINCSYSRYASITSLTYSETASVYNIAMGFWAYKVDRGLLLANVYNTDTTLRVLNRQNLINGDGWRLLGPREISKYVLSDLNGTLDPIINPWGLPTEAYHGKFSFYQMPHTGSHEFYFSASGPSIKFNDTGVSNNLGWPNPDRTNNQRSEPYYTGLFLYQYVDSDNATNIYY